jgi:GTP pyrophosphokinase
MSGITTASLLGLLLSAMPSEPQVLRPTHSVLASESVDALALAIVEADTRAVLDALAVDAAVTSRVKAPDSLAAKAIRKGIDPEAVLDRLALRVRVDSVQDCYRVMDTLQHRFTIIEDSVDDYIAHPKDNGYQSLHAALQTPVGVVEFQVRTHGMHHEAELGAASHTAYKATQSLAV